MFETAKSTHAWKTLQLVCRKVLIALSIFQMVFFPLNSSQAKEADEKAFQIELNRAKAQLEKNLSIFFPTKLVNQHANLIQELDQYIRSLFNKTPEVREEFKESLRSQYLKLKIVQNGAIKDIQVNKTGSIKNFADITTATPSDFLQEIEHSLNKEVHQSDEDDPISVLDPEDSAESEDDLPKRPRKIGSADEDEDEDDVYTESLIGEDEDDFIKKPHKDEDEDEDDIKKPLKVEEDENDLRTPKKPKDNLIEEGEDDFLTKNKEENTLSCEETKRELFKKAFKDYVQQRANLALSKLRRAHNHVKSKVQKAELVHNVNKRKDIEKNEEILEKGKKDKGDTEKIEFDIIQKTKDIINEMKANKDESSKELEDLFEYLMQDDEEKVRPSEGRIYAFVKDDQNEEEKLNALMKGLNDILLQSEAKRKKEALQNKQEFRPLTAFNPGDMFILKKYLANIGDADPKTEKFPVQFGKSDGLYINLLKMLKENGKTYEPDPIKNYEELIKDMEQVEVNGQSGPLPQDEQELAKLHDLIQERWNKAIEEKLQNDPSFAKACESQDSTTVCQDFDKLWDEFTGGKDVIDLNTAMKNISKKLLPTNQDRRLELPNLSLSSTSDNDSDKKPENKKTGPFPFNGPMPMQNTSTPFFPPFMNRGPQLIPMPPTLGPLGTMNFTQRIR